ncbi:ATP-dependent endonuclease [Curtobacterium sp. GD1]|uniref:ATP-dependent nuclease n=1 Tax=Curtobacterium sp. GD1 TaxID=2810612 RepID=UPI001E5BC784|nr:ATP-binding protein [Curtobacterium sp. GD1]MCC8907759.1 AAA family ATPase [Curtobacterium sp. GD1]
MYVRRIKIANYRGIRDLDWHLPKGRDLICLIGPGDSGKSTIIEALLLAMGDRWNPTTSDTDFFEGAIEKPIVIRVVVSGLSAAIMKDSAHGLHLSGIDEDGKLYQDPTDDLDPCLIVQMEIDSTLEPVWTIERVDIGDSYALSSYQRREFAVFKVDERTDTHLRWTRTSALGRMSAADGGPGAKSAMAVAARAARDAIGDLEDEGIDDLTSRVQDKLNEVGSGSFGAIRAGLDTSLSSAGGNLALYEDTVPLANFGLGSKRLSALAIQQMAAGSRSILLVDEIEHGLEPHRLVALLRRLVADASYSQVFITTHSPIAVEQAATPNLAIVRNNNGAVRVEFLPEGTSQTALRLRRSRPSSFLAKRIIVAEGKTEEGLLLALIERWDSERASAGRSVAAGEGVVVQDGQGGSEVPPRMRALADLGYEVTGLLDNDDRTVDKAVAKLEASGMTILRWSRGFNSEKQIANSITVEGLSSLLHLGVQIRRNAATVLNDLEQAGLPDTFESLDVSSWLVDGSVNAEGAAEIIADAMISAEWFKSVDGGRALGEWVATNRAFFIRAEIFQIFDAVHDFIYPPQSSASNGERDDAGN